MEIPRAFKLGGRQWKVRLLTDRGMDRVCKRNELVPAYGACVYEKATIYLCQQDDPDLLDIAFEHELEHAIRFTRGETDHDETVVDGTAHLRHQFNKSRRGILNA